MSLDTMVEPVLSGKIRLLRYRRSSSPLLPHISYYVFLRHRNRLVMIPGSLEVENIEFGHRWCILQHPPTVAKEVLPRSGPEPWFELDFWSGSPWFGPWFSCQPEPDRKTVLGSRSSQTVQFWFDLPEPFPNPKPIVDFYFNYDDVKVSSSGFALLVN
ncbi:uncharacterized protein F5891DRAFT_990897 [Suillus fuscotomentosus]|uniref:Uncharacterized protein n=1 Tax=Suillus fuscotomentosus TaxID=1912939 RepID=A0AAD4DMV9_9AGAM|nr:uncharacterized protein F5891DRAFT_990897 [Suillus fuscotomentosus]KAG1883210.1 hypothetical protein F5891DRAFT_990897 [Suillus fuscotomentosus]